MQNSIFHLSSPSEIKSGMLAELQRSMGEMAEELLPELAIMFLEDAPLMFSQIHQAIINNDAPKVRELAHSIKGSSVSMGITALAIHCQAIENLGHSGELESAAARLEQARAEFEQVKIVLNGYAM